MSSTNIDRPLLGNLRAYWLGVVVCLGGFLFGYDSGIVGGVLTFNSFQNDFRYGTADATKTQSLAVSLQNLGAFVACFFIWPISKKYGRRVPIAACSFVFIIGAMVQTINTHSLAAFYVARVIAGLGLGGATVIVPTYSSEMSPKELRGQIGCFFQLFYTLGILVSYWVDYGVKINSSGSSQWQIPVGLQILPAGLLGLGMLTLSESTRWYTKQGLHDKAWASLRWIRASDGPAVQAEMDEIRAGVQLENQQTEGFKLKELFEKQNFKLVSLAFAVFLAQQSTGATAFAYYAPQYFASIVGKNGDRNLLITGIFGAVKVIACATFVWLLSERVGRRVALIAGAAGMAACHIIVAAIVATHPASSASNPQVTSSGIAAIAFIYLFVIIYNMSWGALPWPYVSEIFPVRIRDPGIAIGVSSQWLFSFVYTIATPSMIANMKYGVFLLWGLFNLVICAFAYFFMRETRGFSLEAINARFRGEEDLLAQKAQGLDVSPEGSVEGETVGKDNAFVKHGAAPVASA